MTEQFWNLFRDYINTDDENESKKLERLKTHYDRKILNDIFITLCGYSFDTIYKEAGELIERECKKW